MRTSLNSDMLETRELFREHYKGANFLTPYFREYRKVGNRHIEITEGKGMDGKPMYGVTIIQVDDKGVAHKMPDESKAVYSLQEIEDHIFNVAGVDKCQTES